MVARKVSHKITRKFQLGEDDRDQGGGYRDSAQSPAQELVGKQLDNGWIVEKSLDRPEGATGGHFSISYAVRSANGEKAFLKAMDYRRALQSPDPATELQAMTEAYNFERALLEKCRSNGLSRIIRILDSGTLPPRQDDPSSVVQYMIFEFADHDIRSFIDWNKAVHLAWALRTIHDAAAALQQLHRVRIAHQDIKPSNVLIFADKRSKLADLGRAFDRDRISPHDEFDCAGDMTYAPPELLYGYVPQDWRMRRFGCDMYLLGSLVVFLCAGVSMTHLLFKRLHKDHHFENWGGTYEEVLPYLQHFFMQIVRELRTGIHAGLSVELSEIVMQLCNPDPKLRGHPKNIRFGGNQFSLERFVSKFNLLAVRAEYSLTHREQAYGLR